MTGEVLYRMFTKFALEEGCGMDKWDDLDATDRNSWNRLAAWLQETEGER